MLLRDMGQPAFEIIGPGVIGADDALTRLPVAIEQSRAAMLAGVQKRPKASIIVAQHQDRYAGVVVGQEAPGLRQRA